MCWYTMHATRSSRHCGQDCVATGTLGPVAAACLMGVMRQVVDQGELVMVRTEETSPSAVKSSLVQQCTLLKFAVEKERPTRLEAPAGDLVQARGRT